MRVRAGLCLIVVVGFTLAAVPAAWAQSADVSAVDNNFEPREVEIQSGTTVTWTNEGDTPHTVTADNGSFESGNMDPGDEFSETFVEAGRYPYFCEYHGGEGGEGMSGVVVVTAAGGNGGGGQNGTDDSTDTSPTDTTVDSDLPQTGTEVDAFIYLALALIVAGAVLIKLGSPAPFRR
jgi:LPXTG-motif cell wall-anchored protein